MSEPVFAVVGHPNKGKSSLVATLARDATVAVSPEPGTTRRARRFPMRIDGQVLYTLTDTPGFQRARAALAWMKQHESNAASRPAVVARFVEQHAGEERFHDECELLRPILEGAGIIYVVDGASPYGPEYEAEMEILRWSGRPSMAIINPIGQPRFVEPWENALGQFFRVVRVIDVLKAPFSAQLELLRAFGHLAEAWREPLDRAATALLAHRRRQRENAARIIAELIAATLACYETRDLGPEADPQAYAAALEKTYRGSLRQLEGRARRAVEALYGYENLDRTEVDMELLETDLLSEESWLAFGLRQRDLVAVGAAGGAVAGGAFDVAVLGASFFAGTVIGGLAGGALGYFSSQKLAETKVLHQPLGGKRLRCGPTKNVQFPFVLLGRARLHHALVAARTHAQRTGLVVDNSAASSTISDTDKRRLAGIFGQLRRYELGSERYVAAVNELSSQIAHLLEADESLSGSSGG